MTRLGQAGIAILVLVFLLTGATALSHPRHPTAAGETVSAPKVPVAVVVPVDSPLTEISGLSLRLAFLGEIVFLEELLGDRDDTPHRTRGNPLHLCLNADAETLFLDRLLSRNYQQYRRYWANRVLSGEPGQPPVRLHDAEKFVECIEESYACIGVVTWPPDSTWVGLLRPVIVDGKLPGDSGYLFGQP